MITQLREERVKNQICFMALEDRRDLPPVTDNMHEHRLLEGEAQVLGGNIISASEYQRLFKDENRNNK